MPTRERAGSQGAAGSNSGGTGDRFIRLHQVLRLHHAHPPSLKEIDLRDEPETLNDCLILTQGNIQQFHLTRPFRWGDFSQIKETLTDRQRAGGAGHNVSYPADEVFSPVKVVLAEADSPIRAALCYEPAYPWQCKLATRLPGQRLWMVYAALAVLNSPLGGAYYRSLLRERPPASPKPHGLKARAVNRIPVARVDWEFEELGSVAGLTHQIVSLHQAQSELEDELAAFREPAARWVVDVERHYRHLFAQRVDEVRARLNDALRLLLGLTESEEHRLLTSAQAPRSSSSAQLKLYPEWELLPPPPPPPPVVLATDLNQVAPAIPEAHRCHLRLVLEHWQEVVNGQPPRELYVEPAPARESL